MSDKGTEITFGSYLALQNFIYARFTRDPRFSSSECSGQHHDIYQEGGLGSTSGSKLPVKQRQKPPTSFKTYTLLL